MAVEAKAGEPLGGTVGSWLDVGRPGSHWRGWLAALCQHLGIPDTGLEAIRYQLLNRVASALIKSFRATALRLGYRPPGRPLSRLDSSRSWMQVELDNDSTSNATKIDSHTISRSPCRAASSCTGGSASGSERTCAWGLVLTGEF